MDTTKIEEYETELTEAKAILLQNAQAWYDHIEVLEAAEQKYDQLKMEVDYSHGIVKGLETTLHIQ